MQFYLVAHGLLQPYWNSIYAKIVVSTIKVFEINIRDKICIKINIKFKLDQIQNNNQHLLYI